MKQLIALSFLFFAGTVSATFEQCRAFFPLGEVPVLTNAPRLQKDLCFDAFAVLHSGESKTPLLVAERLNRAHLLDARDEERTDKFYPEARLPQSQRAQLIDYKTSAAWEDEPRQKFDRGHMAPAANMPNAQAMAQSFSLANMVPQAPMNNRKLWSGIEASTRKYVLRAGGDVYVLTGPLFSGSRVTLGPGQVWVPSHLFKLVYDPNANRAWVHLVKNSDSSKAGPPLSYTEFVRVTGLDLLPAQASRHLKR